VKSAQDGDASPVTILTVRACCVILHDGQVALIHRQRPGGDQYSLPGGIVHADEEVPAALARELNEELGLDVTALPRRPELRRVTSSPPAPAAPRRSAGPTSSTCCPTSHCWHARSAMAGTELDAEDHARIVWTRTGQASRLQLYPAVGGAIEILASTHVQPVLLLLPPITDQSFRWR